MGSRLPSAKPRDAFAQTILGPSAMLKVRVGELAPLFKAKIRSGGDLSFGALGGRYIVLVFVAGANHPSEQHLLTGLQSLPDYRFDGAHSVLLIVSGDPEDANLDRLPIGSRGAYGIYDSNGTIADLFGVAYQVGRPISYLLSPRMQVFGIVLAGGPQQQINTIRDALRRHPPVEDFGEIFGLAPVLIVPHVFEDSLCRELIDYYNRASESARDLQVDEEGRSLGGTDPFGNQRSALLQDPLLVGAIRDGFIQRIFPQMARAYQFEARHLERLLVARHDANQGGHLAPQRDDPSAGTVHRRFAALVNLNSKDYEGGELCFPEFSTRPVRSPGGSALVFSCSLLYQTLPVRRGTRYALLSFIYESPH
jgi:hypothetical protein